jgi:hypothetical protein
MRQCGKGTLNAARVRQGDVLFATSCMAGGCQTDSMVITILGVAKNFE